MEIIVSNYFGFKFYVNTDHRSLGEITGDNIT